MPIAPSPGGIEFEAFYAKTSIRKRIKSEIMSKTKKQQPHAKKSETTPAHKSAKSNPKGDKKYASLEPYPASEDVYSQDEIDSSVDPDDPTRRKARNEAPDAPNEKDFQDDMTGEDLDIPGNGEDEHSRANGDEDEENNYYSLGG